ncbi:thioredoxin fold domain-containing protein [Marinomonas sp. 15G1-11]|uniref:Thiol:disulfide interchange protein n=1 Tax=Marinomonas phaeophyticola TaxID=3004091 RepID=A0ABT4JX16_9GAMM|nr:thioredoxin fold domain-containing protein [Marinomonas sp. 15G1-11]MCZ2722114.1 thioredoxin fold domain-containing protein [Marinomonas sp. 15G1-11]
MKHIISKACKVLFISATVASLSVFAAPEDLVRSSIQAAIPQYPIESIKLHEGTGLYVVSLGGGPVLHVSTDGKSFIAGDVYRVETNGIVNETELAKIQQVEDMPLDQMVVYPAKGEEKAHISVFTDVDCGYCRMLHKEVTALNEKGITVRYLGFPRAGTGSAAHAKLISIWCSDDPQKWMTEAKLGKVVPTSNCENPIAEQYQLGQAVGVRGTPSIVLSNGKFIPGYLPADELAKELGL